MTRLASLLSAADGVVSSTRNQTEGDHLVPRAKVEALRDAALNYTRSGIVATTPENRGLWRKRQRPEGPRPVRSIRLPKKLRALVSAAAEQSGNNFRREIAQRLFASFAPSTWLPIDQAPRDGRKVWLWVVMPAGAEYAVAVGSPEGWASPDVARWNEVRGDWDSAIAGTPTHFMHVVPPMAPIGETR